MGNRVPIDELAERIRALERGREVGAIPSGDSHSPLASATQADSDIQVVTTGWEGIDAAMGGGLGGGLHEWFGVEQAHSPKASATQLAGATQKYRVTHRLLAGATQVHRWTPPICIPVHLAWQAIAAQSLPLWTVWVGRHCHPYPRVLIRDSDRRLLEQSLFVAPRDASSRLWAIDLALRSPAVGLVVTDGSGFDRPATQRVQMLARSLGKCVLSLCPPQQVEKLSAAQTRWRVCASPAAREENAGQVRPRWSVRLLRCKGRPPTQGRDEWLLEWNRDSGRVDLSAGLADLAGATKEPVADAGKRRKQRTA